MEDVSALEYISQLPNWMIYSLAILMISVPAIMEIIRSTKNKKVQDRYDSLILDIANSQSNLYKNFNILLDVLYEKYANNLNLELTQHILELVYIRTKYDIILRVQEYIHDESKYNKGILDITSIRQDLTFLVANKYHQDIMLLNKLTFKSHKLSEHLVHEVKYKRVIEDIIQMLSKTSDINRPHIGCNRVKHDLDSYFIMLINKSKNYFENLNLQWEK